MLDSLTLDGGSVGLDDAVIADLRERLRGGVILENDPDYEAARRVWNAIAVVHHGKDARIVANAALGQDVQGPERFPGDREKRRPMTQDRTAGRVFEQPDGAPQ